MSRSTNAPGRIVDYPVCIDHPFSTLRDPVYPVTVGKDILAAIGTCPGCGGRMVYKSFQQLVQGPDLTRETERG